MISPASPMSKTAARKAAAEVLRWGHFRPSAAAAYVRCKQRHEVRVELFPWANDREVHDALLNALADHIREDCTP